jgi:hypothetical protein
MSLPGTTYSVDVNTLEVEKSTVAKGQQVTFDCSQLDAIDEASPSS